MTSDTRLVFVPSQQYDLFIAASFSLSDSSRTIKDIELSVSFDELGQ